MKFTAKSLVFTVFLLWLTIQVESEFEAYLGYIFILSVGILHGANDISLIHHTFKDASTSSFKYLGLYIFIIVVTSITFFLMPSIALLIFVGFSCYHFGEQHFYSLLKYQTLTSQLLYVGYGILIFGLLFYFNADATSSIILDLTEVAVPKAIYAALVMVGAAMTFICGYLNLNNFKSTPNYFQEAFLILLFTVIFKLASLLWAFAIYFVIWHSIPSLKDQIVVLYGKLNKQSIRTYIKASFANWLISIVGLVILYYLSSFFEIRFITLFFAFLAAITLPHVIVMYYLNKK